MNNSSAKGANFERAIAVALSRWITNGKKDDCFWRTAISGGRATQGRKRGELIRQSGDITAVAPEGHVLTDSFFIECKHRKNLSIPGFLLTFEGDLYKFWEKAGHEADYYGKQPILIARQNRYPIMLIMRRTKVLPLYKIEVSETSCAIYLFDDVMKFPFKQFASKFL